MSQEVILEVKNLRKYFPMNKGRKLRAVDGVSFSVKKGETLGLVGESGCGKTTVGRTIINIYAPTEGEIIIDGIQQDKKIRRGRVSQCNKIQMIFQDPYLSLNPRMTVGDIIAEGWDIHRRYKKNERKKKINELLDLVGLNHEHSNRFPHEFSGGQRQRIGIARALSMDPEIIICDEPISALDVSIQAQVMNLLIDLQRTQGLTYLFIAHDLSMVRHISDNIAVMYLGKIMEYASSLGIYAKPSHPYTQALFSSVPIPKPKLERQRKQILLEGDVQSLMEDINGCRFAGRCPRTQSICHQAAPEMKLIDENHWAACHLL